MILVPSAQPRRRRHRRQLVQELARHRVGRNIAAVTLPLLHGPRQQSRLVCVHAGRDADGHRLAVQRVASADRERHPPAGIERHANLHPAVHGSDRAEHRSDPRGRRGADGQVDDVAHHDAGTSRASRTTRRTMRGLPLAHTSIITARSASSLRRRARALASPITVSFDSLRRATTSIRR